MTPPTSPADWQWILHAWVYLTLGEYPGDLPIHGPTFDAQVEMVARALIDDLHPDFTQQPCSSYHNIYRQCHGSPPFNYALTFPGVEAIELQIKFGEAHLRWLEDQHLLYPLNPHPWNERIEDMNWRLGFYRLAREVVNDRNIALKALARYPREPGAIVTYTHYVGWTRSELRSLEEILGPDIRLGILPPVVPSHTFRKVYP